jgi:hypothetical protein
MVDEFRQRLIRPASEAAGLPDSLHPCARQPGRDDAAVHVEHFSHGRPRMTASKWSPCMLIDLYLSDERAASPSPLTVAAAHREKLATGGQFVLATDNFPEIPTSGGRHASAQLVSC